MKAWLKWLSESEYVFKRIDNSDDMCRVYDFGNGIIVYKYEHKNGGTIFDNGFMIPCGSVKYMTKKLEEILG